MPISLELPPKLLAHKRAPVESSFETKTSYAPAEVRLVTPTPGSKSAVSSKGPMVKIFPLVSTAMEFPMSNELPPKTLTVVCAPLQALAEGLKTEVIENDKKRIRAEIAAKIFLWLFKFSYCNSSSLKALVSIG